VTAPGDRIGDLVVERRLGAGSFASVWLVRHEVLRSRHALKLLELATNPRLRDRFLAEGRILAQLRHPNLVAVTGVVQDAERVGLVMDLVDGPTLAELLADGAVPRATAIALVRGVADGMEHAHEAGIVHRDLKPENVLVTRGHDGPRPVVVDFGIAKVLADASVDAGREASTRLTVRMGTPRYMAPEQVEAAATVDRRADVFALGAILYELLLGRFAFEGANDTEILFHVVQGLRGPTDGLDPALRAIVERALATRPADRFPTCRALVEALDALPAEVVPPPATPRSPEATSAAPTLPPEVVATEPVAPPVREALPTARRSLLAPAGALLVAIALVAATAWSLSGTGPIEATAPMVTVAPAPVEATPATPAPEPVPTAEPSAPPPAPAPASPPREVRPAAPPPPPPDDQLVKAAWQRQRDALDGCARGYDGVLKIDVRVASGGRPVSVDAVGSPRSSKVEACAEEEVRRMKLGRTAATGQHVLTYRR
jgi:serine/threonine-protein kinase